MKKLSFVLVAFIAISLCISCQKTKKLSNSEDVGPYVLELLRNFDTTTPEDFKNSLFTLEEIKAFGEKYKDSIPAEAIQSIELLKKEAYDKRINSAYEDIKNGGENYNIDWNAIDFYRFNSDKQTNGGLTGIRGELQFTFNDTIYTVRTTALLIEEKYIPVIVNRLRQKERVPK
ncbi:MAG: hypothetical protein AAF611_07165 [Bacteroidota bacterium]